MLPLSPPRPTDNAPPRRQGSRTRGGNLTPSGHPSKQKKTSPVATQYHCRHRQRRAAIPLHLASLKARTLPSVCASFGSSVGSRRSFRGWPHAVWPVCERKKGLRNYNAKPIIAENPQSKTSAAIYIDAQFWVWAHFLLRYTRELVCFHMPSGRKRGACHIISSGKPW